MDTTQATVEQAFTSDPTLPRYFAERLQDSSSPGGAQAASVSSAYASLAHTKPFYGNINSMPRFKAALDARGYNHELLLTMSGLNGADLLFTLLMNLEALGWGHHLVLTNSEKDCHGLALYHPTMGCMWGDVVGNALDQNYYWDATRRIWMLRWLVVARAINLGYNVLLMDSDVAVLADPYPIVKAEPFTSASLIFTGHSFSYPGVNCGLVYVQNAVPYGPTAWLGYEVARRTLTWFEDIQAMKKGNPQFGTTKVSSNKIGTLLNEQVNYNDALCSTIAGRNVYRAALLPNRGSAKENNEWNQAHFPACVFQPSDDLPPLDPYMEHFGRVQHNSARLATMRLPAQGAPEWEMPTGSALPFVPTNKYVHSLRAWLEPDQAEVQGSMAEADAADAAIGLNADSWWRARQADVEEVAMESPPWLFTRFIDVGPQGAFVQEPPLSVMAHMVRVHRMQGADKAIPYKLYGWWWWQVDALMHGLTGAPPLPLTFPYRYAYQLLLVEGHTTLGDAARVGHTKPQEGASTSPAQVPAGFKTQVPYGALLSAKFVAMAPYANLFIDDTAIEQQVEMANALAKLAAMSGRIFVWPLADCRSHFLWKKPGWKRSSDAPYPFHEMYHYVYGRQDDLKCLYNLYLTAPCQGIAMVQPDFEQSCRALGVPAGDDVYLWPGNTLLFDHYQKTVANFDKIDSYESTNQVGPLVSDITAQQPMVVDADEVEAQLKEMEA